MFQRRWLLAPGLALAGILFATNPAVAGVLDASWTAPTTNSDGSPLTDLASYRVYFGTSATPCPSGTFVSVPSPSSTPPPGQAVGTRLTGLTNNTVYNVSVAAVDTGGNPSACSGVASATATPDITVTPTATVAFGNVNIGTFAEQTFTVQSTRAGVTGTAAIAAPFTIVSGSPFTLSASGATQTVTVRFTPTNTTPQSVNVNFTADGDSMSRLVTGTGLPIGPTLTVSKSGAGSGTVTSSPAGISCGTSCSASYVSGTQVTLTASPAAGSTFTGWTGGGCTGTGTCVVTMNAATTVAANFTVPTFALTVTRAGAGSGTVTSTPAGIACGATCSASFNINTVVTLTAAPASGSTFVGWGGSCVGAGNCTVTMTAARAVTATFGVSTVTFTDDPLVAGSTVVRVLHIAELRTAVAFTRARFGLSTFAWSDTLTARTTQLKVSHIVELRTAVTQIYQALGRPLPAYTDNLVAGQTGAKAVHVQELRRYISQIP
jgi:Divergent InlB B-repeat domain